MTAVTLEGKVARLEPLVIRHAAGLCAAGVDGGIWIYLRHEPLATVELARVYVEETLAAAAGGAEEPFAIVHLPSGQVAGSTRYMDIRPRDRGLEIGSTWIGTAYQRSALNTECKYLLLRHAFEERGMVRVQLKTDLRNIRSQRAIERIGAQREGVLRKHMLVKNGFIRDSVLYSITDEEWPAVKRRLEDLMFGGSGRYNGPVGSGIGRKLP